MRECGLDRRYVCRRRRALRQMASTCNCVASHASKLTEFREEIETKKTRTTGSARIVAVLCFPRMLSAGCVEFTLKLNPRTALHDSKSAASVASAPD